LVFWDLESLDLDYIQLTKKHRFIHAETTFGGTDRDTICHGHHHLGLIGLEIRERVRGPPVPNCI
jgi:hypothetical protein